MAGEREYTRIPPESTGDRVGMVHTAVITYDGLQNSHVWQEGEEYFLTGGVDSNNDFTVHLHNAITTTAVTGVLYVHYEELARYQGYTPEDNQTIRKDSPSGDIVATINGAPYEIYLPANNIVGYKNPQHGLEVDVTGSASIRFDEGRPQLDAWGKLRVSGAEHLGDYVFGQESKLTDNFSRARIDGGYTTWSSDSRSVKIGIDPADPQFDGTNGFAASTSNTYHHYFPGSSHLYMATCRLNNPSTLNSTRQWGMFDADNGFFFSLGTGGVDATDTTGFSVVIRSSYSAAAQKDLIIPRSDWNGDKLDGTGGSQAVLNLENSNIWWIDTQWHGAGRARFGTYINGQRVVCHSYFHSNSYPYTMGQTVSLPVCFSNKSTATTNLDLFLETWSASVWTETSIDLNEAGKAVTYHSPEYSITSDVSGSWQYLFSMSPEEEIEPGVVNHTLYMPTSIHSFAYDSNPAGSPYTDLEAIVDIKAEVNAIHSGHNFSLIPGTTVEVSNTGTSYNGGQTIYSHTFKGEEHANYTDVYNNFQYGAIKNLADDGGIQSNTISGISVAGSPSTATITTSDPQILLREPQESTFPLNTSRYGGKVEIYGSTVNDYNGTYYLKITSSTTAELYDDKALTTPSDLSAAAAFTGTATIKGFYGSRLIWSFFAKTRTALHNDVKAALTIEWKEIVQ
jgi:hypothetical protein